MSIKKKSIIKSSSTTRRTTLYFKFFLLLLIIAGLVAGVYTYTQSSVDDRSKAADTALLKNQYLEVGPEEVMLSVADGVQNAPIIGVDAPFITMKTGEGVRGYISAAKTIRDASGKITSGGPAETYTFLAPNLDQVLTKSAREYYRPSLSPAQTVTKQDDAGSWMTTVMPVDDQNILGWFHGEQTGSPFGITTMRQFAALSKDGGRTWKDLGLVFGQDQRNNTVGSADSYNQVTRDDVNMNTVIKRGNTLYSMFSHLDYQSGFAKADASQVIAQMRAGQAGASLWKKYLCLNGACSFSSEATGGIAEKVPAGGFSGGFAYNTALQRFVNVNATAQWGVLFYTGVGGEPTNWSVQNPLVAPVSTGRDPRADSWNYTESTAFDVRAKNYNRLARLAYTSLIAPDGTMGTQGNEFYVYYVKGPEFQNFGHMVLVRRKVRILPKKVTSEITVLNPLIEYRMNGTAKTRTSVDNPIRSDYASSGKILGWLATHPASGFEPLYECYYDGWDDYMIVGKAAVTQVGNEFKCEGEAKFVRLLGYVSKTKTAQASLPIIGCFDEANLNHFYVTTETGCGSAKKDWTYGYLLTQDALQKTTVAPQVPETKQPSQPEQPDLPLLLQTKKTGNQEKTRQVTSLSQPDSTLRGGTETGKIYRTGGVDRKAVHECYINIWDDYILMTSDSTSKPANFCTKAEWENYKGVIGYVSKTQNSVTNKLFKECFDETNLNHFYVTTADGCQAYANARNPKPKIKDSWTYGYIR